MIDAKTVYTCQDKGSGVRCKKGEVPIGTECTASNISQLFVNNEVISFCLDTTTNGKIDLTGANNGNYLVTKNSNPAIDVFGITGINENYAIVSIQDKIITLNVTYTNNLKYVYANKEKVKIMEHGDKSTVPLTASNELDEDKILELLCKDGRCKSADSVVTIDDSTTGIVFLFFCFINLFFIIFFIIIFILFFYPFFLFLSFFYHFFYRLFLSFFFILFLWNC